LGKGLGETLPATLLFDYPTIDALADYLLEDVLHFVSNERAILAPEADAQFRSVAAPAGSLVGTIEELSDDDVERLLASRAGRR
jgi:hypothetical protein